MSLVQIWIEKDKARVAVDTVVYRCSAPGAELVKSESSKLLALPHAGVVLAYRGVDAAFFQVLQQVFLSGDSGYDAIAHSMPERVRDATTHVPPEVPREATSCEVHLVGYSACRAAFAATSYAVDLSAGKCESRPLSGPCRLVPGFASAPELGTNEAMLSVARQQLAWMEINTPREATGGRLLVAELTREGISLKTAGGLRED